jgi:hypothetical protein
MTHNSADAAWLMPVSTDISGTALPPVRAAHQPLRPMTVVQGPTTIFGGRTTAGTRAVNHSLMTWLCKADFQNVLNIQSIPGPR